MTARAHDPLDPHDLAGPVVVVVNPLASRIRDARRGASIVAHVDEWVRTTTGHAPITIRVDDAASIDAAGPAAIRAGAGLVVAVGGDGTVAALTAELAGSGIPLGIVPGGTGNVLATALRIPDSPMRALKAMSTGLRRPIDLGSVDLQAPGGGPEPVRVLRRALVFESLSRWGVFEHRLRCRGLRGSPSKRSRRGLHGLWLPGPAGLSGRRGPRLWARTGEFPHAGFLARAGRGSRLGQLTSLTAVLSDRWISQLEH